MNPLPDRQCIKCFWKADDGHCFHPVGLRRNVIVERMDKAGPCGQHGKLYRKKNENP